MDLTQLFKASVKTVRLRCKTTVKPDKGRILKTRNRDDFLLKANDVRYQVTQLRDLLIENRPAYMRFGYHLKTAIQMTDTERDIIDSESEKIILICSQYITDLKTNILERKDIVNTQFTQHKLRLLDILTEYLKNVYRLHKEQKENRIRHEMETLKLLKLRKNDVKKSNKLVADRLTDDTEFREQQNGNSPNGDRINSSNTTEYRKKIAIEEEEDKNRKITNNDMGADDFQVLEYENSQLLNDLKGLSDEVEQIEKNVTGIAKLQEIFTEKVCQIEQCNVLWQCIRVYEF